MKPLVNRVGGPDEQEANQVTNQVMQQINGSTAPTSSELSVRQPSGKELQMKPCQSGFEEWGGQLKPMVQRQTPPARQAGFAAQVGPAGGDLPAGVEAGIQQARSGGQPLAEPIRPKMEQAFGADFSGVRLHTDAQADRLNRSLQAKAFTTGQDIFFKQGAYNPDSSGGQQLIAHELTHVAQQNNAVLQPKNDPGMAAVPQESVASNLIQRTWVDTKTIDGVQYKFWDDFASDQTDVKLENGWYRLRNGGGRWNRPEDLEPVKKLPTQHRRGRPVHFIGNPAINGPNLLEADPEQQEADNMAMLYTISEHEAEAFAKVIESLAEITRGEAKNRSPLKSMERAADKAVQKGGVAGLSDIVGSSIIYNSLTDLRDAIHGTRQRESLAQMLADQGYEVVRVKNRFVGLERGGDMPDSRYRDFLLNIKTPLGLIVELQLHFRGMIEAKEDPDDKFETRLSQTLELPRGITFSGHDAFDFIREIDDFVANVDQFGLSHSPDLNRQFSYHMQQYRQLSSHDSQSALEHLEQAEQLQRAKTEQTMVATLQDLSETYNEVQQPKYETAYTQAAKKESDAAKAIETIKPRHFLINNPKATSKEQDLVTSFQKLSPEAQANYSKYREQAVRELHRARRSRNPKNWNTGASLKALGKKFGDIAAKKSKKRKDPKEVERWKESQKILEDRLKNYSRHFTENDKKKRKKPPK
jgi:hypothetical protein